ncbi:MAG: peptidoglycan editing factor PgeF [Lachnospiraceae bacterium]|nr:peptidoglycan editing factor PgeF [Lachnospiraceae bacterium]
MIKNTKNGVEYLTFENLSGIDCIRHAFSTRKGGVSEGIYASMNLGYTRGDVRENVDENFRRMAGVLGCSPSDFVTGVQTHTVNVRHVTKDDAGKGVTRPVDYSDTDGLITNEPGLVLTTFYADCVPLFFVDPIRKAIGLSHSGWRGTVNRMGLVTINAMKEAFGTDPSDLVCAIGPSICMDCYEISEDVALEFEKEFSGCLLTAGDTRDDHKFLMSKGNDKYLLDLRAANRLIMLEAGVPSENIELPGVCTCHEPDYLFSHRASHGQRGNMAGFLGLI